MNIYVAEFPGENYGASITIASESIEEAFEVLEAYCLDNFIGLDLESVEWQELSFDEPSIIAVDLGIDDV